MCFDVDSSLDQKLVAAYLFFNVLSDILEVDVSVNVAQASSK